MLWYYEKDNKQNGPIPEEELLALYNEGVIRGRNLVWREGMADWAPLRERFPMAVNDAAEGKVAAPSTENATENAGVKGRQPPTGGQSPNSELRLIAREALAGAWGMAVLVFFLYGFLQQVAAFIPVVGPIAPLVLTGPLSLGLMAYFVGLHRGEPVELGTLFSGFSRFFQGVGLYLVTMILVTLAAMAAALPGFVLIALAHTNSPVPEESPLFLAGMLVALVPGALAGIYMYLRYALIYYIANDHPELGVLGAIKRSTELMVGRKGKFFMLGLSFIGWHFLGMLAFGIGLFWSMTYMWSAFAAFYEDIGGET